MVCEQTEMPEEGGEPLPGHEGCGHRQPLVRKEGLKMFLVEKKVSEDDDMKKKVSLPCLAFVKCELGNLAGRELLCA